MRSAAKRLYIAPSAEHKNETFVPVPSFLLGHTSINSEQNFDG